MEQKDYLKKQIDQLGEVLATLLDLLVKSKTSEPNFGTIVKTENQLLKFGINFNDLKNLDEEKFLQPLKKNKNIAINHYNLLANILLEKGRALRSPNYLRQSKALYEYLQKNASSYDIQWPQKIDQIQKLLQTIS